MIGVSKMMNNVALKVAVSAIAIGTTMVGCTQASDASRPSIASARSPKSDQQAASYAAKASAAAQKGDLAEALAQAERAVEFSPSDVGYRMLLADLYLKNGRFQSAETTFTDVLRLDPGNGRASLSAALTRIALGRSGEAIAELDELSRTAPPADVGLAYALAGDPRRAIEMLEPAARASDATGRVRQNLALAYALAGDWQKAKIVAAQDVSPAELGNRLQHWASLAQPTEPWSQVAALLGVNPVSDAGQPVRLALAQPAGTALAAAEAAPAPEPAPVRIAQGGPEEAVPAESGLSDVAAWVSSTSDPVAEETTPLYAEAVETLVKPQPTVIRPSAPAIESRAERFDSAPRNAPARTHGIGTGRFAVQLGAFSTPKAVERAWAAAYKRYGFANETPLSTTVRAGGSRVLHRLSVAGFSSHGDASQVCRSVKAKGGVCFVRAVAGDAPVQWASRYTVGRRG
jgi:Flp pilus assembly protein TadD